MTNAFDKTDTRTPTDKKLDEWLGEDSLDQAPSKKPDTGEAPGGPQAPDTPAVRSLEQEKHQQESKSENEELNEALEESFPASDPISQTSPIVSTQRDGDKSQ